MSTQHNGGNAVPEITREEHDGTINAKRVTLVSGQTIYAIVNTSAVGQASVVVDTGANWIGLATVNVSNPTLYAVVNTGAVGVQQSMVTIFPGPNYIGLASVNIGGTLPPLSAGVANIGFASVTPISSWPDPKGYIGLASVNIGGGNVGLNAGIAGIGFATINVVNQPALVASAAYVGLASVNIGGTLPALTAGVAGIGFSTVNVAAIAAGTNYIGSVTVANATAWPDPKTFIGLVTVQGITALIGNVTISDSKGFIGLTTNVPATYGITGISSVASLATVTAQILPSNSNRYSFTLRNISNTTIFFSFASPTTTSGMYLRLNDTFTSDHYRGAVFGILNAGTAELRYIEESL